MQSDFGDVRCSVLDGVLTVTINRPRQRNAVTGQTIRDLRHAFAAAKDNDEVRVIVLTGAGEKAFCAGADLLALSERVGSFDDTDRLDSIGFLFRQAWDLGKPTVAKVRGYAVAAGLGLALMCDIVIAGDDAFFGAPEILRGLWPMMITAPMLRSMPPKIALELMMSGRLVDAVEARSLGFVNRVVPTGELDLTVHQLAGNLARQPAEVMRIGRTAFYQLQPLGGEDTFETLHRALLEVGRTDAASAGVSAFRDRSSSRAARPGHPEEASSGGSTVPGIAPSG
jgi:enoyl-CoA hydratase/carnithine racemase